MAAGLSGLRAAVAGVATSLLLAACSGTGAETRAAPGSAASSSSTPAASAPAQATQVHAHGDRARPVKAGPLRPGEKRLTLEMDEPYTPAAPTGVGTDDYRCFLLDPGLERDAWLTGTHVLPGNPEVVHHVILFRVPPEQVAEAEAKDDSTEGPGWTCFGGSGLAGEFADLDDAAWLGAWAPGGEEDVTRAGYGVELPAGSRVVMQVHYNLLAGTAPDVSATQLRVLPASRPLTPLHTYLMPAPVELPCRPGRDAGPLCDRAAAVADVKARFGDGVGATADLLHLHCGTTPKPTGRSSCTRTVGREMTILGAAGHMHLLGRKLRIEANPGTPRARTVLDIPLWDFDDQGSRPVDAVTVQPFDELRITCHHVQWLRDRLPAFAGQEERYVVWGDGTTDEMCLGMLSVAY